VRVSGHRPSELGEAGAVVQVRGVPEAARSNLHGSTCVVRAGPEPHEAGHRRPRFLGDARAIRMYLMPGQFKSGLEAGQ
jgi:hypothetical protein